MCGLVVGVVRKGGGHSFPCSNARNVLWFWRGYGPGVSDGGYGVMVFNKVAGCER